MGCAGGGPFLGRGRQNLRTVAAMGACSRGLACSTRLGLSSAAWGSRRMLGSGLGRVLCTIVSVVARCCSSFEAGGGGAAAGMLLAWSEGGGSYKAEQLQLQHCACIPPALQPLPFQPAVTEGELQAKSSMQHLRFFSFSLSSSSPFREVFGAACVSSPGMQSCWLSGTCGEQIGWVRGVLMEWCCRVSAQPSCC